MIHTTPLPTPIRTDQNNPRPMRDPAWSNYLTRFDLADAAGEPRAIDEMIDAAIKVWPQAQIQIRRAGAIVENHRNVIERHAENNPGDWWRITDGASTYSASISQNYCNCHGYAPEHAKHGRLCAHRIAAMFQRRRLERNADRVRAIIERMKNAAEENRNIHGYLTLPRLEELRIVIVYDLLFSEIGENDKAITQIGANGIELKPIGDNEKIQINNAGLDAAARAAGFTISDPIRTGTISMKIILTPITEENLPRLNPILDYDRAYLKQRDARQARRENIGAMIDEAIATNAAQLAAAAD